MTLSLFIAFAAYVLLAVTDLSAAFLLLVAALPLYIVRFSLFGLPTTALETLFLILFIVWILRRKKRFVDIHGWKLLILFWIVVATAAVYIAPSLRAAAGIWKAYFVEPVLFFIMANDLMREEKDRRNAFLALAISAVGIGALAVVQRWTGWAVPPPFNGHPIPPDTQAQFRSTAVYGFPNAIGLFLAPLIPVFTAFTVAAKDERWKRMLWGAAALLSAAGIIFAQSEGAIVGTLAGLGIVALCFKKTRWPSVIFGSVALVVLLLIPVTRGVLVEKATLSDWSGRVRTQMWGETWNMLQDHFVLGAGLSGYPVVFDKYHKARYIEIFQYPHDIVLNFWTELGLAGVFVFFAIVVNFFRRAWRLGHAGDRERLLWAAALAGAMTAILVHGLVDVPYLKNDLSLEFWLLVAFLSTASVGVLAKKKKTPSS